MKKLIAKEILILFFTGLIFGLILFIGWIFQPKEIKFKVSTSDFIKNPKTYSTTQEAYLAAFHGEPSTIASESYKTRLKEYDENNQKINTYWWYITLIEIILLSIIYPIRGLFYLIKWCLNTIKN